MRTLETLPFDVGTIHFVGIGGIGMSGIAEVLCNLGYRVQGSDISENANVLRLRNLGVRVIIGHDTDNILNEEGEPVTVVVRSTAVTEENVEVAAARDHKIPVIRRAQMLAELMRLKWSIAIAGTHGKTTTTSLVGCVLEGGGFDPTIINGGIVNAYGTNARMGTGDWMVVEADESDGSFIQIPSTIAVITNIDPEHLDHYGDFETLKAAFKTFITNLPFYGFVVACIDHPEVKKLISAFTDRRIITYGFSTEADIQAAEPDCSTEGCHFKVIIKDEDTYGVTLPMFGDHNILNALAAIAVAREIGVGFPAIKQSLESFAGVKRRFTKTGTSNGITVIDDYAHHPVEIEHVLAAGRSAIRSNSGARLIAVMQPHRYSRLASLFDDFCACFHEADTVIISDVYTAGEDPINGADRDGLVKGIQATGHDDVLALENEEGLSAIIHDIAQPGDLVICLGAGSITHWANALPEELDARFAQSPKSAGGSS